MPIITNLTTAWSKPIKLAQDEVWQARGGTACISTETNPGPRHGIALKSEYAIPISAGKTVRYRKEGTGAPYIVREAT